MLKKRKFKGKLAILLISAFVCIFTFLMGIPKMYAYTTDNDIISSTNICSIKTLSVNSEETTNYIDISLDDYDKSGIYYAFTISSASSNNRVRIEVWDSTELIATPVNQSLNATYKSGYFNISSVARSIKLFLITNDSSNETIDYIYFGSTNKSNNFGYTSSDYEEYNGKYGVQSNILGALATYKITMYYDTNGNGQYNQSVVVPWSSPLIQYTSQYVRINIDDTMSEYSSEIVIEHTSTSADYYATNMVGYIFSNGVTGRVNFVNDTYYLNNPNVAGSVEFAITTGLLLNNIEIDIVHTYDGGGLVLYNLYGTYEQGYNQGYDDGYSNGYSGGYNQGASVNDTTLENNGIKALLNTIMSYPINMIKNSLNFSIFGVNISALVLFALSLGLVIFVIKKFWK